MTKLQKPTKPKHPLHSNKLRLTIFITIFATVSVFGISFITGNHQQSGVGNSSASAIEPADINNDNTVNVLDLSYMLGKWKTTDTLADLNQDGLVNVLDLSRLLAKWGPVAVGPGTGAGAQLPITYDLNSLPGTKRYVATNGNDTTGNGTIGAPYATLKQAITVAASGDSIVVRGGVYRNGNNTDNIPANKTLRITAYPGEIPIFNGAQTATTGWTTEGSMQYRTYTPMPVTDASGISFSTGQNLTGDGVGKFPDQAFVGNTQLRQVTAKTSVVEGTFWVDSANNRIYLSSTDVAKGGVEVSNLMVFLTINSPNSLLEGIKVIRYSNTANNYGLLRLVASADNTIIRNVELSESAWQATQLAGGDGGNLLNGVLFQNVTISRCNWMGVGATYTDNFVMDKVVISDMNQFDEFAYAPQSGALKTSRTRYTVVKNSEIINNHSHGLWFDQSNVDVDVANNRIVDNLGSGVFFEISDDLLLINNYIKATGGARATRLAGSSGLKIINNTVVGGADVMGIFADTRSFPGCADPTQPLCAESYSSDRDTVRTRPATLDWMPRVDLMYNNIIAYSTNAGWCGNVTMCMSSYSSPVYGAIQTIIHLAEPARGIPQTFIDHNIYANGTNKLINANNLQYSTLSSFTTAMAGSPVLIGGIEANSKAGNSWVNPDGSPTSTLSAIHNQAVPIPIETNINQYISAGTRHYGVLNN
jgi:hypothetical protein